MILENRIDKIFNEFLVFLNKFLYDKVLTKNDCYCFFLFDTLEGTSALESFFLLDFSFSSSCIFLFSSIEAFSSSPLAFRLRSLKL